MTPKFAFDEVTQLIYDVSVIVEISTMTDGDANFYLHKTEAESTDKCPSLFALFISFTSAESKQIDSTNQYADKLVTKTRTLEKKKAL